MWLFLALLGHLLNAFVYLTDKAFVAKLFPSPKALAFISGISGAFTFVLFPWFLSSAPLAVVLAAIGSGAVSIFALIYFFTAVGRDEVSRVVPAIGSLIPPFTFALSYGLLGERLGGETLVAFILLTLGGLLVAVRSFRAVFEERVYSLLFLELLVGFLFALSFILQKFAFNHTDDFSAFLWSRIGGVAVALPLFFSPEVRSRLTFDEFRDGGVKKGGLYFLSRIFAGISPLVILFAISLGSATLVNALQGVQYAFLYILALFFARRYPDIFKEEISGKVFMQKGIALVLIITGLVLLARV